MSCRGMLPFAIGAVGAVTMQFDWLQDCNLKTRLSQPNGLVTSI